MPFPKFPLRSSESISEGYNSPAPSVALVAAASAGVQVARAANGDLPMPPVELLQSSASDDENEPSGELSPAARRYLELSEGEGEIDQTVRVDVDDQEPWFIRRMDAGILAQAAHFMPDLSAFDPTERGIYNRLLAGLLWGAVVRGDGDDTPFFETSEEAVRQAYATAPRIVDANAALLAAIIGLHPQLDEAMGGG